MKHSTTISHENGIGNVILDTFLVSGAMNACISENRLKKLSAWTVSALILSKTG